MNDLHEASQQRTPEQQLPSGLILPAGVNLEVLEAPEQPPLLTEHAQSLGHTAVEITSRNSWRNKLRRRLAVGASVLASMASMGAVEAQSASAHGIPGPDPTVVVSPYDNHTLIETSSSDLGQYNRLPDGGFGKYPAAFPIYESKDGGTHWKFMNYVFPPGHSPKDAEAPDLNFDPGGEHGHYWAPELHYINGLWVVYFAATGKDGKMALFEADTKNLLGGNWHSSLLHKAGSLNHVKGNTPERNTGDIDPTMQVDPETGQLIFAFTNQPNQSYIGQLTPNGLHLMPRIHMISYATRPWEHGVEEGQVLFWNKEAGVMEDFFNAASTWGDPGHGHYAVGVMASADPLKTRWVKDQQPVLQGANGRYNPGMGSKPVQINGKYYVFYHEQDKSYDHNFLERYLTRSPFSFDSDRSMYLPSTWSTKEAAKDSADTSNTYFYNKKTKNFIPESQYAEIAKGHKHPHQEYVQVKIPRIGDGYTQG